MEQGNERRPMSDEDDTRDKLNNLASHQIQYLSQKVLESSKQINAHIDEKEVNIQITSQLPIRINLFRILFFQLTVDTQYKLLKECAAEMGWFIISEQKNPFTQDFDIFWHDVQISQEKLTQLKPHQKVNHFPYMFQITKKAFLAKNLKRMKAQFPEDYNFFPMTWCLPSDYNALKYHFQKIQEKGEKDLMIIKPSNSAQGKGIFLSSDPDEITQKCYEVTKGLNQSYVVQKYVKNPYLLGDYKFDLRLYVLVLSCNPLRVFLYEDGIARFASNTYQEGDYMDKFTHLTNYAVNKTSTNFVHAQDQNDELASKRTLKVVLQQLENDGVNTKHLKKRIKDIIIKTILSIQQDLYHNYRTCQPSDYECQNCFEILGFDILIDANARPWLLEVNQSPSFSTDSPLDYSVKKGVVLDAFKLLNMSNEQRQLVYDKLELFKQIKILNRASVKAYQLERDKILEQFRIHRRDFEEKNCGGYKPIFPIFEPRSDQLIVELKQNQNFILQQYYNNFQNASSFYRMAKQKVPTNSLPTNNVQQSYQFRMDAISSSLPRKINRDTYLDLMENLVNKLSKRLTQSVQRKLAINTTSRNRQYMHEVNFKRRDKGFIKNQGYDTQYNDVRRSMDYHNYAQQSVRRNQNRIIYEESVQGDDYGDELPINPEVQLNAQNIPQKQNHSSFNRYFEDQIIGTKLSTKDGRFKQGKKKRVKLPQIRSSMDHTQIPNYYSNPLEFPHDRSRKYLDRSQLVDIKNYDELQRFKVPDQIGRDDIVYVGPEKTQIKTSHLNLTKPQMIAFPQETVNPNLKLKVDFQGSPKYNYIREALEKYLRDQSPPPREPEPIEVFNGVVDIPPPPKPQPPPPKPKVKLKGRVDQLIIVKKGERIPMF